MMDSKVYQLIAALPSKALEFIHYQLLSPNNYNEPTVQLYNTLRSLNAASKSDFSKEKIYQKLYPSIPFNDQKWRLACSVLLKRIERILLSLKVLENENSNQLELIKLYKELNLKGHYESQLKRAEKHFGKTTIRDSYYQDSLIELEDEKSEFLLSQKRNQDLNIQETLDRVDVAYLIKKLKFASSALAHQSVYSIEYDLGLFNEIELKINHELLKKYPALELYYSCYLMMKEPDNLERFEIFRNNIINHQKHFEKSDIRKIYLLGINMCIRRLNSGEKEFGKIGLEMYDDALKRKLLLINGKLSRYTYRNITMMAIRSDDFEWADNFTESYKNDLKKSDMKSGYHFNKALIHYYKNELEKARDNIVEADFKDHLIHLAAKALQAKIYFELKEVFLLSSHLDSMEMYIIRKKVVGNHKQNYKNFISYLRKAIKLKPYDQDRKLKLLNKVKEEEVLTERKWFIKQLG